MGRGWIVEDFEDEERALGLFVELEKAFEKKQVTGGGTAAIRFLETETFSFADAGGDRRALEKESDESRIAATAADHFVPFNREEFEGGFGDAMGRLGAFGNELERGSVNEREVMMDEDVEIRPGGAESRIAAEFRGAAADVGHDILIRGHGRKRRNWRRSLVHQVPAKYNNARSENGSAVILFQNHRGGAPFVGDGPEVHGLDRAAVFQVAGTAIGESEVRAAGIAASVHVVSDDVAVVAGNFFITAAFLIEIHMDVAGVFGFFAEGDGVAGERNGGELHAVRIVPLHDAGVIFRGEILFPEIVEAVDEVAAVLHEGVARALEDFRVLIIREHGVHPGVGEAAAAAGEFVIMIAGIHGGGEGDLTDVVEALGGVGFSFGASERWEKHGSENADDANNDEEFNQREGAVGSVFHFAFD